MAMKQGCRMESRKRARVQVCTGTAICGKIVARWQRVVLYRTLEGTASALAMVRTLLYAPVYARREILLLTFKR